MEDINILEFISCGCGDGYGEASGSGNGVDYCSLCRGYGYGRGEASGSGCDDGSGTGYGNGEAAGGYCCGDGAGNAYGSGDGSGSGSSYDSGYCSALIRGSDDSFRFGRGLKSINGKKIYMLDGIATTISRVRGNTAKGTIVNSDLTQTPCYIVKNGRHFAHGKTLAEANAAAQRH